MMKKIEKNIGEKIEYRVVGTKLNLNDELILDLAKYERDHDVHLDISENEYGMITMGANRRYLAQIDIPARKYEEVKALEEEDIETDEGTEIQEDIKLEAVPFSMENVTLTLWTIEGGII